MYDIQKKHRLRSITNVSDASFIISNTFFDHISLDNAVNRCIPSRNKISLAKE